MKKTIILLLLIAVIIGGIFLLKESFYKNNENKINNEVNYSDSNLEEESPALRDACAFAGGTWLADFSQCEYVDQEWCEYNGGVFSECESACRNNPEAEVCTLQCVPVCQFAK